MKNETMPAEDERRELVPVIIAGIVAAIGLFCLWADLRDDLLEPRRWHDHVRGGVAGRSDSDSLRVAGSSGNAADGARFRAVDGRPGNALKAGLRSRWLRIRYRQYLKMFPVVTSLKNRRF